MPKLVEVINDFSGGIAKGYSPENLQNNQMQKCDNLIADGVGKLSTVPNVETQSTSDVVSTLPVYSGKNIHSWSSDTTLNVTGQPNNVSDPVVRELKQGIKARFMMIMSRAGEFATPAIRLIDKGRNDQNVFYWNFAQIKGFEYPNQALGKTLRGLDSNIHNDEVNSNPQYMNEIPYKWNTHSEMQSLLGDFTQAKPVSYVDVITEADEIEYHWREGNVNPTYHNGDVKVSAVRDSNWTAENHDSYGLRTMITFEYYGALDLEIVTNDFEKVHPNQGTFRYTFNTDGTNYDTDVSYTSAMAGATATGVDDFIEGPHNTGQYEFEDGASTNRIFYTKMDDNHVDSGFWGQFAKWEFVLTGASGPETATYSLMVDIWTASDHSTNQVITVTHENEINESAEFIMTALFTKLLQQVLDLCPDQELYYEWKDDGTGLEFYQDSNTEKPYGIKDASITKSNIETHDLEITPGQNFSDLLVVADDNAQANIYSLNSDNWLDYPIDLRTDTNATMHTPLVFSDTEGYLKVADQHFFSTTKPKWFGFLNLNEYNYVNIEFDVSGGFYIDDMSPKPFTETVSGGQLDGQYSHVFIANNLDVSGFSQSRIFQLDDSDANQCTVDVPLFSTSTPSVSGLKLFVDWIDGTYSSYAKLDGSFTKRENAKFYYVYKYHGGAISQPQHLHNESHEDVNHTAGNSPKDDNVALGLSLSMGQFMINGNDSEMVNVRLKGIEIYGYFPEYDANDIYLALEIDLIRGWKTETTGDWIPLQEIRNNDNVLNCYSTCKDGSFAISELPIFKTHPVVSFYAKYKISWNKPIGFADGATGFRTACVYNRRAYYGNVRIKGEDQTVQYFPDGILKSVKGHYDAVSVDNMVPATINDGDEITCLRVAGNKLMQFKKKSLTIMGIKTLENGESREVIEQTIDHCGISGENQVTQTPYGIFWVTRSGIYIFDGNRLDKLTENLKGSTISKTEWENFYGPRTHVGYDAYWNQAHICQDTQNNPKTLIYAFNTRAFTESNKLYASDHKTGFVNNTDGHLLWAQVGTGSNSITTNSNNSPNFKDRVRESMSDEAMQNQEQQSQM